MKNKKNTWKAAASLVVMFLLAEAMCAQVIHRIGIEGNGGYIFPTNRFLKGQNYYGKKMEGNYSAHLKYSVQFRPHTAASRAYAGAYQGIGLGYFDFGNRRELGTPLAFYLFQGGRMAQLSPRLSLNYEWNFGVSTGWKSYHRVNNPNQKALGSPANAYLNLNFYLNWVLSPMFDLTVGAAGSHFSNGNTRYPNSGLNTVDCKVGLVCNFNRKAGERAKPGQRPAVPPFLRHASYDLTLFGSWRKKAVRVPEGLIAVPGTYPVWGFSFAPMYNFGYRFRAGVSLDGVYDGSANISSESADSEFSFPPFGEKISLGLSARGELVMPYFTVGIGFGGNILHGGGELKSFYQILALKIDVWRNAYLHVGYNLRDFHEPSYLMLGIGYRFHDKRPKLF